MRWIRPEQLIRQVFFDGRKGVVFVDMLGMAMW